MLNNNNNIKMKTPEEILNEHYSNTAPAISVKESIIAAMVEYATQQAMPLIEHNEMLTSTLTEGVKLLKVAQANNEAAQERINKVENVLMKKVEELEKENSEQKVLIQQLKAFLK